MKHGGEERLFIVTENDNLLYFDGYENVTAKRYKDANNKTVKSLTEEKQYDEYGGHTINMKVTFTDGSEILLKDANRNFFE